MEHNSVKWGVWTLLRLAKCQLQYATFLKAHSYNELSITDCVLIVRCGGTGPLQHVDYCTPCGRHRFNGAGLHERHNKTQIYPALYNTNNRYYSSHAISSTQLLQYHSLQVPPHHDAQEVSFTIKDFLHTSVPGPFHHDAQELSLAQWFSPKPSDPAIALPILSQLPSHTRLRS